MQALNYALIAYGITAIFAMLIAVIIHGLARLTKKLGLEDPKESAPNLAAAMPAADDTAIAIAVAVAHSRKS